MCQVHRFVSACSHIGATARVVQRKFLSSERRPPSGVTTRTIARLSKFRVEAPEIAARRPANEIFGDRRARRLCALLELPPRSERLVG